MKGFVRQMSTSDWRGKGSKGCKVYCVTFIIVMQSAKRMYLSPGICHSSMFVNKRKQIKRTVCKTRKNKEVTDRGGQEDLVENNGGSA